MSSGTRMTMVMSCGQRDISHLSNENERAKCLRKVTMMITTKAIDSIAPLSTMFS